MTRLAVQILIGSGWPEVFKKKLPNFSRSSPKSLQTQKNAKIEIESPKCRYQTTFETLKYLQQTILWTTLLRWKCNRFAWQKIAQNIAISLGYFIFSKNHNEPPKVAQLAKTPNLVTLNRINRYSSISQNDNIFTFVDFINILLL